MRAPISRDDTAMRLQGQLKSFRRRDRDPDALSCTLIRCLSHRRTTSLEAIGPHAWQAVGGQGPCRLIEFPNQVPSVAKSSLIPDSSPAGSTQRRLARGFGMLCQKHRHTDCESPRSVLARSAAGIKRITTLTGAALAHPNQTWKPLIRHRRFSRHG